MKWLRHWRARRQHRKFMERQRARIAAGVPTPAYTQIVDSTAFRLTAPRSGASKPGETNRRGIEAA